MFTTKNPIRVMSSGKKEEIVASYRNNDRDIAVASLTNVGRSGISPGGQSAVMIGGVDVTSPFIDALSHKQLQRMYADMYENDGIAGATVDLMCDLPFSDFKLTAPVSDSKQRDEIEETFEKNLKNLSINTLLPTVARESLVFGAHVSQLLYSRSKKEFTDTMPFPYIDCEVKSNILFNREPVIRVTTPDYMKQYIADKSDIVERTIKSIDPSLMKLIKSGSIELDPIATMYLPRKTFSYQDKGISLFRRIIPYYLLEKVLFKGTLTLANRRQSSIIQIAAGSDEWDPTQNELQGMVDYIINANRDPIGAVIATNNNVQISEFSQGGDFWKWSDSADDLANRKMQSLGVNESFLSGDSNYSTMEAALSVFVDNLRSWRNTVVNILFYNKLFPNISYCNDFTTDRYDVSDKDIITAAVAKDRYRSGLGNIDMSKMIVPTVEWKKSLTPIGDQDVLTLMETLEGKGVPFGLRAYAAAAGMDFEQIMAAKKVDIEDRANLAKLLATDKSGLSKSDDDEDEELEEASLKARFKELANQGTLKRKGILNRTYTNEEFELVDKTPTGKKKFVVGQDRRQREANETAAKAIKRMSENSSGKKTYYPARRKAK